MRFLLKHTIGDSIMHLDGFLRIITCMIHRKNQLEQQEKISAILSDNNRRHKQGSLSPNKVHQAKICDNQEII